MNTEKIFLILIISILLITNSSATLSVSLSDQGTGTKLKSTGDYVNNGNLKVEIYDNLTAGNLIYSETFTQEIKNGSWNVMLGENSSNPLNLDYGKIYYRDYEIDGVDIDFTDYQGNTVERKFFYSPLGEISDEDISGTTNITTTGWFKGKFNLTSLGSFISFLSGDTISFNETKLNETIIKLNSGSNSTFNATYNTYAYNQTIPAETFTISVNNSLAGWIDSIYAKLSGGNSFTGDQDFNGGWSSGGLSIAEGNLFAQTIYVYNLSSLAVNELNVNGSIIPQGGFDNTFDIGSGSLRWRDLYLSGEIYSNGTGNNYFAGNVGIGTTTPGDAVPSGWKNVADSTILRIDSTASDEDAGLFLRRGDTDVLGLDIWHDGSTGVAYIDNRYNNALGDIRFRTKTNGTPVDAMTIDGDGKVGIGTSSPQQKLDVAGNIRINTSNAGYLGIYDDEVAVGYIGDSFNLISSGHDPKRALVLRSETNLSFATGGSNERMYIDSSGNVGIGTTSPGEKLEVSGNVNASGNLEASSITINGVPVGTSSDSYWNNNSGDIYYNSGNVGIGTSSPAAKFHVYTNDNNSQGLNLQRGVNFSNSYSLLNINDGGNNFLVVKGDGTVYTNYGNVGIGTTSPSLASAGGMVVNHATSAGVGIWGTKKYEIISGGGLGSLQFYDVDNSTVRMIIDNTGNVGIGTSSPGNKLHIKSAGVSTQSLKIESGADTDRLVQFGEDSGGNAEMWMFGAGDATKIYFSTNSSSYFNGGNVGIGTSSPQSKLEVENNVAEDLPLLITGGEADLSPLPQYTGMGFGYGNTNGYIKAGIIYEFTDANARGKLHFATSNTASTDTVNLSHSKMTIDSSGNVGIGTSNPQQKLNVIGNINATGTIYKNGGTAVDYVFDSYFGNTTNSEYDGLIALEDLQKFIEENHYLPNYEPEKYTGQIEVGKMSEMNLEKIEELTIYILELENRIENLEEEINEN